MTETGGQPSQDKAYVHVPDVIRDDEDRTSEAIQMVAAVNARPAQQKYSWP
jgi:hypothetical protein